MDHLEPEAAQFAFLVPNPDANDDPTRIIGRRVQSSRPRAYGLTTEPLVIVAVLRATEGDEHVVLSSDAEIRSHGGVLATDRVECAVWSAKLGRYSFATIDPRAAELVGVVGLGAELN
jgi:hypothetical protein